VETDLDDEIHPAFFKITLSLYRNEAVIRSVHDHITNEWKACRNCLLYRNSRGPHNR
jgi:hypothetical protein